MAQRFKAKTLLSNSGVFNNQVLAPNLIYNTGDQTISGSKTFSTGINIVESTFPQSLRVFNKTGTNTGEFGLFGWNNNQLIIGSQQTNSGVLRDIILTGQNVNINPSGIVNINSNLSLENNLFFASQPSGFISGSNFYGNYNGGIFIGRTRLTQATSTLKESDFAVKWRITPSPSAGTISRNWKKIAVSDNGKYQAGIVYGGTIYISDSYGDTWPSKASIVGNANWNDIAISSDGKYLIACGDAGSLFYLSNNYGASWRSLLGPNNQKCVAINSDGSYQLVVAANGNFSTIYISRDYGVNWSTINVLGSNPLGVGISSDGKFQRIALYSNNNSLYSNDYGFTWQNTTAQTTGTTHAKISSDGLYQILTTDEFIKISKDYGNTWVDEFRTPTPANRINDITISANAHFQAIALKDNYIYASNNYGKSGTWSQVGLSGNWSTVDVNSNGKTLSAAISGGASGFIFLSSTDEQIQGDLFADNLFANNIVYNTGNQTISGIKTFTDNIQVSGTGIFNALDLNNIDNLSLSGVDVTITSGNVILTNPVSSPNLVYNTGNQTISGIKTFGNSGVFSLSGITPLNVPTNPISIVGSGNTYIQVNIQNRATGTNATADLVITANNGTDSTNYINLGINNSGYNDPTFSNGTGLDGYLFINGGNLDIGTQTPGRFIEFHAGGGTQDKTIARISESGLNLISGTLNLSNSYLSGDFIRPNSGIALYNRAANARQILTQVESGGRSIAFQPSFVSNRVIFYQPRPNSVSFTNTTTNLNLSVNTFAGGVIVARPIYLQTNDILGYMPRIGFQHTGGLFEAGFSNDIEPTTFRGTGGLGGFFFQTRFGISENKILTSGKGFWGLWDRRTVAATVSNPGGIINTPYGSDRQNIIGVGFNSGDTNLSFIHADNVAPGVDNVNRRKVSLGSNFPISSGNVYEFSIYALPDQPYVDMTISILRSGISTGYRATTALPAPDYALAPNFSINGPNASGNIAFDLCSFYLDTPL